MISEVGEDILNRFSDDDIFCAKILSLHRCYGKQDFCRTYQQKIGENFTALIGFFEGALTLFCDERTDFDELKEFVHFLGAKSVFCNRFTAENLDLKPDEIGAVLRRGGTAPKKVFDKEFYPDFKSVYALLKENIGLETDYNSFVSDLSYRIKYGFCDIISAENAVAFTGWITDNTAVISAVAVDKSCRQKGLGSQVLSSLCAIYFETKRNIFVYTDEKTADFYIKNSFFAFADYCVITKGL